MTLVFRAHAGSLQQVQVGLPDIMSTLSLAQSAWGWVGGLRVVSSMLKNIHGVFADEAAKRLAVPIQVGPAVFRLFTSDGSKVCSDDSHPPFGEDFPTQLIGLSICAIAHIFGGKVAVELFMKFLAPTLLTLPEAHESLYLQLIDNHAKIVNEGATRGLTTIFSNAVDQVNQRCWNAVRRWNEDETSIDGVAITDMLYVNSFLRWVTVPRKETYFTRCNLVMQLAACMSAVGYCIGEIQAWDGAGDRPRASGSNSVILVTGSTWDTDIFLEDQDSCVMPTYIHHYHFSTAGGMFSNALGNKANIPPEVFQTLFEYTHSHVKSELRLHWKAATPSEGQRFRENKSDAAIKNLFVEPEWTCGETKSTPISKRLASLFFPKSAPRLGPCYEQLSNLDSLEYILQRNCGYDNKQQQRDLATFSVITVSIVIAAASVLAGESFMDLRHCIDLNLEDGDHWQRALCPIVDDIFSGRPDLSRAVFLLAAVHAGCETLPSQTLNFEDNIVGWRHGIYTVQPAVIADMDPASNAPVLGCYQGFCANIAVRPSGAIISSSESLYIDNIPGSKIDKSGTSVHDLSLSTPHIDFPEMRFTDSPLYLSIERSPFADEPEVLFNGRIGGRSIGTAGIKDAMITLVLSQGQENCSGHQSMIKVVNITASKWVAKRHHKPVGQWGNLHSFISVSENPSWALFLAGQSFHFDGRVVHHCFNCAAKGIFPGSVLIGI